MFLTPKMPRDRQQRNLTWWSLWSDLEIIVAALMSVKYPKARQCFKNELWQYLFINKKQKFQKPKTFL